MVKIGKSFDPRKRLGNLQTGSPVHLRLLESTQEIPEDVFHNDEGLREHHSHGEWYSISDGFIREFNRIVQDNCSGSYFNSVDFYENEQRPVVQPLYLAAF